MQLKDKTTIVTGGGSGIGRALCMAFAAEGARVVVADINADDAEATAAMINGLGVACDCLLYTSPSPRDATLSRMPSSA